MQMGRVLGLILVVAIGVMVTATPALGVDPGPLERHIRYLRAQVRRLSTRSFNRRLTDGSREHFRVTARGYNYALTDATGTRRISWSRSGNDHILYERWYERPHVRERLLDDDRTTSYTSWYRNGVKWEQYSYNKLKKLRAYYVYNKSGQLLP